MNRKTVGSKERSIERSIDKSIDRSVVAVVEGSGWQERKPTVGHRDSLGGRGHGLRLGFKV